MERVAVTGAGGFIGSHLVSYLKSLGYWVRGIDVVPPTYTPTDADEFHLLDLRRWRTWAAWGTSRRTTQRSSATTR